MLAIFLFFLCFSYAFPKPEKHTYTSTSSGPEQTVPTTTHEWNRPPALPYPRTPNSYAPFTTAATPPFFFTNVSDKRIRGLIPGVDVRIGDIISVEHLQDEPPMDYRQRVWRLIVISIEQNSLDKTYYKAVIFKPNMVLSGRSTSQWWMPSNRLFPRPYKNAHIFPGGSVLVYTKRSWNIMHNARLMHGRADPSEIREISWIFNPPRYGFVPPMFSDGTPPPGYAPSPSRSRTI